MQDAPHTGGGNLPDTGQKTGGRHFNLPDSDQNMFSQTEKVELLKTNNEKSFNSNLIFLPTSAGTTQSALFYLFIYEFNFSTTAQALVIGT